MCDQTPTGSAVVVSVCSAPPLTMENFVCPVVSEVVRDSRRVVVAPSQRRAWFAGPPVGFHPCREGERAAVGHAAVERDGLAAAVEVRKPFRFPSVKVQAGEPMVKASVTPYWSSARESWALLK
jgi:hypothetical protein